MRAKIQFDWRTLPPEAHEPLRASLLAHVIRHGQVGGRAARPRGAYPPPPPRAAADARALVARRRPSRC